MKNLRQYFIISSIFTFALFHSLWAMEEAPIEIEPIIYNEAMTKDLREYLDIFYEKYDEGKYPPSKETIPTSAEILAIRDLIALGADPNIASSFRRRVQALHYAARNSDARLVKCLLDFGINIEARDSLDQTALHYAAMYGNRDVLAMLISLGANIDAEEKDCKRAFHNAVSWGGGMDTIALLASLGDKINATALSWCGGDPIALAARYRNIEVFVLLLGLGSIITGPGSFCEPQPYAKAMLNTYFSPDKEIPGENWIAALIRLQQNQALEHFLIYTPKDIIKQLINQTNEWGNTVFDLAVTIGNIATIKLLLPFINPLEGLYNGVLVAKPKPEWKKSENGVPSLYNQILAIPLEHCWSIHLVALNEELPREIYSRIIQMVIWSKRCSNVDPLLVAKFNPHRYF